LNCRQIRLGIYFPFFAEREIQPKHSADKPQMLSLGEIPSNEEGDMQKIAVVQESPILLNRKKTIEKAIGLIEQAVADNVELVVFPEAFISGYHA